MIFEVDPLYVTMETNICGDIYGPVVKNDSFRFIWDAAGKAL